jgi:hypothetical protein
MTLNSRSLTAHSTYAGSSVTASPNRLGLRRKVRRLGQSLSLIIELSMVATRFPRAAYTGLQKSLQQEWQFLQSVTHGLGLEFSAIALAMYYDFLPALFRLESVLDT